MIGTSAIGSEFDMGEDELVENEVLDPEYAIDTLAEKMHPVVIGTMVLFAVLAVSGLILLVALFLEGVDVSRLVAQAREIDAEKEWALDEFGPRENPGYDVKFGSFLANPLNAAKVRYVRCDIVFTVSDADLFATTGLEQARARAAVVGILGTRTVEELARPGGLDRVRSHLRRALRTHFSEELLLGVHFSEFIVE